MERTAKNIKPLTSLLPFEVDFYAIDFEDELEVALRDALENEYDAVVCDTKAFNQARLMGADAHLLVSGKDSIRAAFSHAVQICELNGALEERTRFLQEMLRSCGIDLVVYTPDGRLVYSGLSERDRFSPTHKRYSHNRATATGLSYETVISTPSAPKTTVFEETRLVTFTVSSASTRQIPTALWGIEHFNADDVQNEPRRVMHHSGEQALASRRHSATDWAAHVLGRGAAENATL